MAEPILTRTQRRAIEREMYDWHDLILTPIVLPMAEPPVYHRMPGHAVAVEFGRGVEPPRPVQPANYPPSSLTSSSGGTRVPTGRAGEDDGFFARGCLIGLAWSALLWAAIVGAAIELWRWLR